MKKVLTVIAVVSFSFPVVAQVAGQTKYYGANGAPAGSSMTYGNTTQYYGANGAPAGTATYSQPVYPADYQQSIMDRTTSQNTKDTKALLERTGISDPNRYSRW